MATVVPLTGLAATIVLVEDDAALVEVLKEALQGKGYAVWHAPTGAQGEALVAEVDPDLILLDLILPDMSGLVLCANLKARARAPIIVVSGTRRAEERILAFKLGADDFITKPFDIDELEARVEALLRRAAAGRPSRPHPRAPSASATW